MYLKSVPFRKIMSGTCSWNRKRTDNQANKGLLSHDYSWTFMAKISIQNDQDFYNTLNIFVKLSTKLGEVFFFKYIVLV